MTGRCGYGTSIKQWQICPWSGPSDGFDTIMGLGNSNNLGKKHIYIRVDNYLNIIGISSIRAYRTPTPRTGRSDYGHSAFYAIIVVSVAGSPIKTNTLPTLPADSCQGSSKGSGISGVLSMAAVGKSTTAING